MPFGNDMNRSCGRVGIEGNGRLVFRNGCGTDANGIGRVGFYASNDTGDGVAAPSFSGRGVGKGACRAVRGDAFAVAIDIVGGGRVCRIPF